MCEHQILINRTLKSLYAIKYRLQSKGMTKGYNDLLILSHIVPELPVEILASMLHALKPHEQEKGFCIDRLLHILQVVPEPSELLSDFLACMGYMSEKRSLTTIAA